jgi:hypothetical protein
MCTLKMHIFWDFHIKIYILQIFFFLKIKKHKYTIFPLEQNVANASVKLYSMCTLKIHFKTQGSGSVFTHADPDPAFPIKNRIPEIKS